MQIAKIEHDKFVGQEAELVALRNKVGATPEGQKNAEMISTWLRQIQMMKQIHARTGLKFNLGMTASNNGLEGPLANVQPPANENGRIAAFVEPGNNFQPTVMIDTLDLPEKEIMQIAEHEKIHHESKINSLDPQQFLEKEDYAALLAHLKVKTLTEKDLVEGFTDFITNQRVGKNEKSAYQKREVPLAEKLEKIAKEKLQISLAEIFTRGPASVVQYHLKKVAREILIEQEVKKQLDDQSTLPQDSADKNLTENLEFKNMLETAIKKERSFHQNCTYPELKKSISEVIKQTHELQKISKSLKAAA